MLFLKRVSDQFEVQQKAIREKWEKQGLLKDQIDELAEDPTQYGDSFSCLRKLVGGTYYQRENLGKKTSLINALLI